MVFHFQLVLSISWEKSTTFPYLGCLTTCDKVFHLHMIVLDNQSFGNNYLLLQDKIWLLKTRVHQYTHDSVIFLYHVPITTLYWWHYLHPMHMPLQISFSISICSFIYLWGKTYN